MNPGQKVQLQITKMGWKYQLIDKTFPIKNPPAWFDDSDSEKALNAALQYITSKYQNCKIVLNLNYISDIEKKVIESELQVFIKNRE